jgi:hypothetical protein
MKRFIFVAALFALSAPVSADKSSVTATNGVVIDVNSDEFSGRYEYTAPSIDIDQGGVRGAFYVAAIKKGSTPTFEAYQGFVIYSGEWRFYTSAVFKGGDPVRYKRTDGSVGSCRYGCTLTENFTVELSRQEIEKYAEGGILQIQVSSKSLDKFIISIPVKYFEALHEVAKK